MAFDNPEKRVLNTKGKFTITREYHVFNGYITPNGFLTNDLATHALFRYYLSARYWWEKEQENLLAYEGEVDSSVNYQQMFSSIARLYGVEPEYMAKFWHNVDMQCRALHIPLLPDEDRYRFNKPIVISTEEKKETN